MAKFFSRLFSSGSSFRGSQTSLSDTHNQSKLSSNTRTASSLENLASYHVISKELEKNKLHKAAWEGNLKKVQRLARPGQINVKDQQARTPLHLAVVKGHIDIVRYLVDEDAKLDVADNEQRTPLIKAVLSGNQNIKRNYQICEILLNGGADKFINSVDKHGRTALHYAIDFANEHLVGLFLSNENCDPNFKDHDQMTPLHLAIKRNSTAIVQLLLSNQHEQQADPNIINRFEQTPLHLAASVGYVDIIRLLLVSNLNEPCDPTIVDSQQLTAYELAKNNHHEICAKLIDEYQEKWLKKTPRRLLSTSFNEQSSLKATNSISMHPKANLQRENDATSEDSSSMSTNKPSKSPPRRTQRPSDQWSDDTGISASETKPVSHGLTNLIKNNPLKPHTIQTNIKNNENSTLNSLAENNPLQMNSKRPAPTAQRTQSSSIFGIQPAFNRKDSDNTSTSISNEKLPKQVQPILEKKSNIYVNTLPQQPSHTKSWSDDTITVPAAQIKKSEQHSETWDTSTSDDDNIVTSKPQHVSNILQKTLPFSPSKDDAIESDSDNNSVDTEIQKFDINKPSNETTIQKLVNNKIGNGYRVIGLTEIHSPVSEDSSWTTTSAKINKESIKNTKGITNLIQQMKTDESTWDDSHVLSHSLKQSKDLSKVQIKEIDNLIQQMKTDESTWDDSHQLSHSLKQSKGIENLVKIMDTIVQTKPSKQPTSSNIIGKLITTSMFERADSRASENTLHEVDNDEDYEQSWKKKSEELPVTSMKDHNSKKIQHSSLPYDINNLQHGSISSTKSSFSEIQINELKENIKKLEPNQEDTQELKRQLKDMENKKNNFEKLYKENNQMLRQIENKLEQEKNEKQRLEWTTKNLNIDLQNIKQKLQLLEDEKDLLNQRCNKLKEERDNHDEKLRMLHTNNLQTSNKNSYHDDDIDKIQSRHREELKLLSAENDDLHYRTKQLESDLELHKESLDVTVRYKIDLEKALEEKTFYQHELDRLKHEKDLIEQEKLEYKTKYDSLQDEIRLILLDRSKLEQKLTSELQEHMQEKQRSTDDKQKYRIEIEQLNIKLNDAEARLRGLQTHNEALLVSKDRDIKNEFESLSHRLNQIESNKLNAEQRYHNQHNEITNKQQQQVLNEPSITHASTTISNNHTHDQHSHSSSCKNCNAVQRSYEQEREYRLQTEKDNERLRHSFSHQKQYQYFNKTFPLQQQNNENYLIENSRKIRSDTERVKSELNRLREDFDKLVSNYEPINNFQQQVHLRSQIDTFRQFYENEFQQRQLLMSKLTPELKSSLTQNYHQLSSPHLNHNHSFNETCTTCTNSRLLRERLDTAIDTSLADQRLQKIKQIPSIPRQASSLLTINTLNHGMLSSIELLRERYYV